MHCPSEEWTSLMKLLNFMLKQQFLLKYNIYIQRYTAVLTVHCTAVLWDVSVALTYDLISSLRAESPY